jgi:hypothetical protein
MVSDRASDLLRAGQARYQQQARKTQHGHQARVSIPPPSSVRTVPSHGDPPGEPTAYELSVICDAENLTASSLLLRLDQVKIENGILRASRAYSLVLYFRPRPRGLGARAPGLESRAYT